MCLVLTRAGSNNCSFENFRLSFLGNDNAALRSKDGLGSLNEDAVEKRDESLQWAGLKM
jgi:hypothetical protein